MKISNNNISRKNSFGQTKLSIVDKFGVYLSLKHINDTIKKRQQPYRVLDLGCGFSATLLQNLSPKIYNSLGVDVKVDNSKSNDRNFSLIESTIEDFINQNNHELFDVIFIISVLEHLWEPQSILEYCYNHLSNNGILIINVPTWCGKIFLEFSAFRLGLSPNKPVALLLLSPQQADGVLRKSKFISHLKA